MTGDKPTPRHSHSGEAKMLHVAQLPYGVDDEINVHHWDPTKAVEEITLFSQGDDG